MLEKTVDEFVRRKKECGRVSSMIFFLIDLSFTEGKYLIEIFILFKKWADKYIDIISW